jgi:hypothetical protein
MKLISKLTLVIEKRDLNPKDKSNHKPWIKFPKHNNEFNVDFILISKDITKDDFRASKVYPEVIKIKKTYKSIIIYANRTTGK